MEKNNLMASNRKDKTMSIVMIVSIFVFISLSTYLFNRNKLSGDTTQCIIISALESLFTFTLLFMFTLDAFITIFWVFLIGLVLLFAIGIGLFYYQKELDTDWDLQIETILNTLTLYFMTLMPLLYFLIVFRFQPLFLQWTYSIAFTIVFFIIGMTVKSLALKVYEFFSGRFSSFISPRFVVVWSIIGLILFSLIFFQLPTTAVKRELNVADHLGYLQYDGFPSVLENNLKQETLLTFTTDFYQSNPDKTMVDYHFDGTFLYLYNDKNTLHVFTVATGTLRYQRTLSPTDANLSRTKTANHFHVVDGDVLLFTDNKIFRVTDQNIHEINAVPIENPNLVYVDDMPHVFYRQGDVYHIAAYEAGSLNIIETIAPQTLGYQSMRVITGQLFYSDDDHYYLFDDTDRIFTRQFGIPHYIASEQAMIHLTNGHIQPALTRGTLYIKETANGETMSKSMTYAFNVHGLVIGESLFLTGIITRDMDRIEVLSSELEYTAIHKPYPAQPLFRMNQPGTSRIINHKQHDNGIDYLQFDYGAGETMFRLQSVHLTPVATPLPHYAHYGLGILIPMIGAWFIPISNYRQHITIIDFMKNTRR